MQIGLIGLGKMGYNLGLNLLEHDYEVVAYDVKEDRVHALVSEGAKGAFQVSELVATLSNPRVVWLMVPAGEAVDRILNDILPLMEKGDILIDGGNSHYKDSIARYRRAREKGVRYFDVGTSGGVSGARNGACLMIGGDADVFPTIEPIFADMSVQNGYYFAGGTGSGHFLKMIHNGIEYGMMQAIAEGFELLEKSPFDYDYRNVAKVWSHGSVIRGWLMELTEKAFAKEPRLESIKGVMHSSGEGKWTVETALDVQACAPVIALSLMMRYRSLKDDTFAGKVVAALRREFGGHDVEKHE